MKILEKLLLISKAISLCLKGIKIFQNSSWKFAREKDVTCYKAKHVTFRIIDYLCTVDTCSIFFKSQKNLCYIFLQGRGRQHLSVGRWRSTINKTSVQRESKSQQGKSIHNSFLWLGYHSRTIEHELLVYLKI